MRSFNLAAHVATCLVSLGALLLTTACSTQDVPRVDSHPASGQKKASAIHHWDLLADDVARRVSEKISDWPAQQHPISLAPMPHSAFNDGFRKLLIGHLLDRGVVLSTEPTDVLLHVDTQLVQHGGAADVGSPVLWTRLGGGVAVERDVGGIGGAVRSVNSVGDQDTSDNMREDGGLGRGVLLVAPQESSGRDTPSRTEVLITTSLQSGGRYLASVADIYYIDRSESRLYRDFSPAPLAPALKTWPVVRP